MKNIYKMLLLICLGAVVPFFFYGKAKKFTIEEYDHARDKEAVTKIFYDDWYWMTTGYERDEHPFPYMLENKLSRQGEEAHPLTLKVARMKGKTVGVVIYHPTSHPDVFQILMLMVDKEYRRLGIARALLRAAIADISLNPLIKRVYLLTRQDNARSQALYKSEGFVFLENQDDGTSHFIKNIK